MSNPLLAFWQLLFGRDEDGERRHRLRVTAPAASATQASATIFLVLRRMRTPLIVLIVIFAVSVIGLTLIPGQDDAGQPYRMTFLDAFYFMSFTATTIGLGEIPHEFTETQRMWVTFSIYLTVIGWAYAIGSLLALLQDRTFREALRLRHFTRQVARLREPFLLLAGYGQTGRLLGHALDDRGRRFVVVDGSAARIEDLDLDDYHADVPGLVGDVSDPGHLAVAGLGHPYCEGVVAITNDDEVNLAVTMTTALLRPDLPLVARVSDRAMGRRMAEFGDPVVVNPFDRFGDRLSLALRAPSSYRLVSWLTSPEDGGPPPLRRPPPRGRWVVVGQGRFGREISADLRTEGFDVTVVQPEADAGTDVLAGADLGAAVGLVAATANDTANLSVLAAARRANPTLYVVARENQPANSPLYEAMAVDALLVGPEMVARETLARLGHPLLWSFLADVTVRDDAWSAQLLDLLARACPDRSPHLWDVRLTQDEAPALLHRDDGVRLGDPLRDPLHRERQLHAVPLLLVRGGSTAAWPDEDVVLQADDRLLLAGRPTARRVLDDTLLSDASLEYVVSGRRIPSSWLWRRLSGQARQRA